MKLTEADPALLYCMFKGEPGTRKSTQALSFPTPQYWFSVDKKMAALTLPAKKWNVDTGQIDYDDYSDWNRIKMKLEQFQVRCPFKTIVLDSITSIGGAINRQTLQSKTGKVTKDEKAKGTEVGGIQVATYDDYKAEVAAFNEMVALTKDIQTHFKVNIILIAHVVGERKADDLLGSRTHHARIIVSGGKNISASLSAYSTEVYHFDIRESTNPDKEGTYGLLTIHTGEDFARTSLGLAPRIEFGNEPLYNKYLLPAINKLKGTNNANAN
jgi:hypothetical protein